jgi:hypothetical protein
MTLARGSIVRGKTACALLTLLQVKDGPIPRKDMLRITHAIARKAHAGQVALLRLVEDGLVTVEYRITPAGAKALREATAR